MKRCSGVPARVSRRSLSAVFLATLSLVSLLALWWLWGLAVLCDFFVIARSVSMASLGQYERWGW